MTVVESTYTHDFSDTNLMDSTKKTLESKGFTTPEAGTSRDVPDRPIRRQEGRYDLDIESAANQATRTNTIHILLLIKVIIETVYAAALCRHMDYPSEDDTNVLI